MNKMHIYSYGCGLRVPENPAYEDSMAISQDKLGEVPQKVSVVKDSVLLKILSSTL